MSCPLPDGAGSLASPRSDSARPRTWKRHGISAQARAAPTTASPAAHGADRAGVGKHGLNDEICYDSSLSALRAEMQAGFEAVLAELRRQEDARRDVPGVAGAPVKRPKCGALKDQPLPDGSLEVGGSVHSASMRSGGGPEGGSLALACAGSHASAAASDSRSFKKGATIATGSDDWKDALDLSHPQSENIQIGGCGTNGRWLRQRVRRFLRYHEFKVDCFFGLILLASSIVTGVAIQNSLDGVDSPVPRALEHVFLLLFVIELAVRVLGNGAHGVLYLKSGWFVFDATLVALGVVGSWIVEPVLLSMEGSSGAAESTRKLVILRVFRLLRLARAFRLLEMFEEVWKLSSGIVTSFKTVVSACMVIIMAIYIFACLGVEFINASEWLRADPTTNEIVQTQFHSLPRTMITLFAFTNGDSIASIYEPMIEQSPILTPFFACVWLFVTVCLMNLVTAVIVDTAIAQSAADSEVKRGLVRKKAMKLMPEVQKLFDTLDTSGEGSLDWREVSLEGVTLSDDLKSVISEEKLVDLFDFLDVDGSGTIDKEEFVDGVMHLAMQDVPVETTQALQLMRSSKRTLDDVTLKLRSLQCSVDTLTGVSDPQRF